MCVDGLEEVVLDSGLVVLEFVEHIANNFVIGSTVGVDGVEGEAVGNAEWLGVGQVPLQFVREIGLQSLLIGNHIRSHCTRPSAVQRLS